MGMSNAERQARWRAKRKVEIGQLRKARPVGATAAELTKAQARIAELEAELKAWTSTKWPDTVAELMARERVAKQQRAIERKIRREAEEANTSPEERAALAEELEQARRQLKAKDTRIVNLTAALARKPLMLTDVNYRTLAKVLHPDAHATKEQRTEAMALLNRLKEVADKVKRQAR
jgi:hypothetical protein